MARVVPSLDPVQDMDLETLLRNAEQLACLKRLTGMAAHCQELRIARHELLKSLKHEGFGHGDVENGLLVRPSSIFAIYRRWKAVHGISRSYRAKLRAGIHMLGSSSRDGSLHHLENQLLIAAAALPEERSDASRFVQTVVLIHDFRKKLGGHLQSSCSSSCNLSCAERSWLSLGMPTMKFKSY